MNSEETYLVYKLVNDGCSPQGDGSIKDFTILRPSVRNLLRFSASYRPFAAWWLFHRCRVFRNGDFFIVSRLEGGRMVHRTCVFPGFYKFPFMGGSDLQLGDIWTRQDHRHRGVATNAMKYILNLSECRNRTLWYVVEKNNHESIKLAENCGFALYCSAVKKNRMGISFIGKYETSL